MTISIWWLIALSQFTLGAVIATVFFAVASKLAKRKIVDLKHIVNQTIVDYQTLADSMDTSPVSNNLEVNNESTESAVNTPCYDNTLSLHNDGMELIPDWSATKAPNPDDHTHLRTIIELYITNLLLKDNPEQATSSWHHFFDQHLVHLQSQKDTQQTQSNALNASQTLWNEKKPQVKDAFDELVTLSQKTDNTSQIHEALNRLYNDFISVINTVPGIEEIQQDALLKMESVSSLDETSTDEASTDEASSDDFTTSLEKADLMQNTNGTVHTSEDIASEDIDPEDIDPEDTAPEDIAPEDIAPEDIALEELEISREEELEDHINDVLNTEVVNENIAVPQKDEISPENILPLSQHDIDSDDDDHLDMPQSAIQEFDEEEASPRDLQLNAAAPTADPEPEDPLAIDDNIFDDLLSTMDDVIDEQTENSKNQDSA